MGTIVDERRRREAALACFRALADEKRLRILDQLRRGERCVCELTDSLEAGQSLLSFHLKVLKDAGFVRDRREGRWSYYSLEPERLADVGCFLDDLRPGRPSASEPAA